MVESPTVTVFDDPEQLAFGFAQRFVEYANAILNKNDSFSVALSGGTTPKRSYELLATPAFESRLDWSRVHLFFVDERCVPPDHNDSNFGMVRQALISKISVPETNVHRIAGELKPNLVAQNYQSELRSFFEGLAWPNFDLILLGMGADGHTASLFPGNEALEEKDKWVVATSKVAGEPERVTLTLPALNASKRVVFLVTGRDKAARLNEVLRDPSSAGRLPAAMVHPVAGAIEWLIDREAAVNLAVHVTQQPEDNDED